MDEAVSINKLATCNVNQHVEVRLEVKKINEEAKIPYRKRPSDAGYDLYAVESVLLKPGRATMVKTGIIISAPTGFYYTIEGRSSLWMRGIFPNRGIIDATYCGEIIVSLVNVTGDDFQINKYDRIAQLILHRQYDANFVMVDEFSDIYSKRGQDGFGSSGV